MSIFLSNRNGSGQTDEEGHFKFPTTMWAGNTVNDAAKAVQNSPLGMSVLLTPGDFKIDSGSGFSYTGWIDTPEEVTLPTANPSNPRIDAVVLYVDLSQGTGPSPANNPGIIKTAVVSGTPTGFPTTPNNTTIQLAVGAGNPFFRVANVRVNAGVTQVSNANITDTRAGVTLVPNGAITTPSIADGAVEADKLALSARSVKVGVMPGTVFSVTGSRTFDIGTGWKPRLLRFTAIPGNSVTNALYMHGVCDSDLNQFVWTISTNGSTGTTSRAGNTSGICVRLIDAGATTNIIAGGITAISESGVITFNVASASPNIPIGYEAIF